MASKELSEAVVELNVILENTSSEVVSKIPKKFIKFLNSIASKTYHFEYDKTKSLEEQNIKPKTKGLIALIYKDYLCDEQEKKDYLDNVSKILNVIEEEKREKYNLDDIFKKKEKIQQDTEEINNLPIKVKNEKFYKKLIKFIRKIFHI